jgi:hypothetical protein
MTTWFCGWSLAIVLHLWLALVKRWTQDRLSALRLQFGVGLAVGCAALVVIPFVTENVGFDWSGATGVMCYYMTTETRTCCATAIEPVLLLVACKKLILFFYSAVYFWTVQWLPLMLVTVVGLGLSISTVYHMLNELSSKSVNKTNRVDTRALFWKYSGKQILFAGLVLAATMFVLLSAIDLGVQTVKLKDDTDDYIDCLLRQASSSPGEKCKQPADNISWQLMVLICYSGLLGVFP